MRVAVFLLVGGVLLGGCNPAPALPSTTGAGLGATPGYQRAYVFDKPDFFSQWIEDVSEVTAPLKGRAGLRYLEIGPSEGRSLLWMLENVLTHPGSSAVVVAPQLDEQLFKNLRLSRRASDVRVLEGAPAERLRELPLASADLIYINGAHRADHVLQNLVGAWQVLAPGGLLLVDDARYEGPRYLLRDRNKLPQELTPRAAIDGFVQTHRNQLQVLRDGYQLYLKKRPHDPCLKAHACSVLEPYVWQWDRMQLFHIGETRPVPLTDEERRAVMTLVWHRGEQALPRLNAKLRQDPGVRSVVDRLGVLVRP